MAETRPHQRVVAMVIAILFFAFTFAGSFLLIWQLYKDNKEAKTVNNSATSKTQAQTGDSSSQSGKLQGTKLASFTPVDHVDSLQTTDTTVGTGDTVQAGDTVTVDYTGAVAATGVIFQSSLDTGQTATFGLSQVIQGWTNGIPGMKVGGTRRLLIPAAQAYGANPPAGSGIPANADLVFDVTLHSIGG
ncbi:MAG TPA: FKBP-type peptidyl-prolyl cis-trans isomerase [Candidatus Saccharimonadales bacterium]|nr:FKBP-type peptidyl-prolyl cis-trans isomerase [Candidatus Saccharimonadales bacterium]